jgi:hypothetical protein
MGKALILRSHSVLYFIVVTSLLLLLVAHISLAADDSVCARVKIEIKQELTLERQAFDAHMRINNGLSHITLENVNVDVSFADEEGNSVLASSDPDNTDALFFIRLDSMDNINDVGGAGTLEPSTSADIHWLIIPAPGASNGLEQGTLYYIGATLTYTIGGEEKVTEVTPDYIFVKPMPEITLDYFLPTDVYGDDAFTPEIEPPIPFSLGVRVKNNGSGVARSLKIDSAQPKIVGNDQGLLIGFFIEGSEVNGQPATDSLLVAFGDIGSNEAGVARWIMNCTLSGQFVEFSADFSHSDELGGELTSLVEAVNTHFLVRDVRVDLPGRDLIRDFLAKDDAVYRVYESDTTDTVVTDHSAAANLKVNGDTATLSIPATAGFMVVQLDDPFGGRKIIKQIIRSDAKIIKTENFWLSKTRNEDHTWQHFINLFDVNTTGSYTLQFDDLTALPVPPVLEFIPDKIVAEDEQVSFIVTASDPNGTTPMLSAAPLPAGAEFSDEENGMGVFDWTPLEGQAGIYEITFTASDGVLKDARRMTITVQSFNDSDGDGMADEWELDHFGTLDRDGSGDFDGDGISDLDEFLNGSDPTSSNAPGIPQIIAPQDQAEVTGLTPDLVIQNSIDPDQDTVTYIFEIYSDQAMQNLVSGQEDVTETPDTTSWTVPELLGDNSWHFWRVRATDGIGFSEWAYAGFFVNTANDPPGAFNVSSPQDNSEVDSQTPTLEVTNSVDVDEDVITYAFEIYADSSMSEPVVSVAGIVQGDNGTTSWTLDTALNDNTWYYWRAIATDAHEAHTTTALVSMFVNTQNDAPETPALVAPVDGNEVEDVDLDLTVSNSFDRDGDQLTYFFEIDTLNTFDGAARQSSGEIQEGAEHTSWPRSALTDNTEYFWRAKAFDGDAESPWSTGSFFVNTANDPPFPPTLKNPGQDAWVATLTPVLELHAALDVDRDDLLYRFEVYADAELNDLVAEGSSELNAPEWVVVPDDASELTDNTWYYWRALAEDAHGATGDWMQTAAFFTDSNGVNDPPTIELVEPSADMTTGADSFLIRWEDDDPETDADISLYYDSDAFGEDGTLIVQGLKEDADEDDDSYQWDIRDIPEGTYFVYGTISAGITSATDYAPGAVTVARQPKVAITDLPADSELQGWVTLTAEATDDSAVAGVYLYLREQDEDDGIPIGYEDLVCSYNDTTGEWEYAIDTTQLLDGFYILFALAVDIHGNQAWSQPVSFSIRNWEIIELLPSSIKYEAGRTIPIKFSIRIAAAVDPSQPFVYNEDLVVKISDDFGNVLQQSYLGDSSQDYRIDEEDEHYITNFKTSKTPMTYSVEIWSTRNNFMVDAFSFTTE